MMVDTELIHLPDDDDNGGRSRLEEALVGRRIVNSQWITTSVGWSDELQAGKLTLDNGTVVEFISHDGGCACDAGCYDLVHLGEVDNIITAVHFEDKPHHEYEDGEGYYSVFVMADNEKINLARFEGTDGNGYYGTGYYIRISKVESNED